jgi:hypothetical protein
LDEAEAEQEAQMIEQIRNQDTALEPPDEAVGALEVEQEAQMTEQIRNQDTALEEAVWALEEQVTEDWDWEEAVGKLGWRVEPEGSIQAAREGYSAQ